MNIITFDIEEWFIEKTFGAGRTERYATFDRYLDDILAMLDRAGTRATFFCVGQMATDFPAVIHKIADSGHEVGCHSNTHRWLNKMTRDEALDDTRHAVDALEQCLGTKVISYRAPAFSIGAHNKWAFEILAQCGIQRDASVFPAARDFGGFEHFGSTTPCIVRCGDAAIKEFPIPTATILGKQVAYSGGGYFRFFPLWYVKGKIAKGDYAMTYFHIGDLVPESKGVMSRKAYEDYFKEKGTLLNRYKRYIKSNLGKKGAMAKLQSLVANTTFTNLDQADKDINWDDAKVITL
ncbi:MAG: polysaccharide deacetylase family protein [Bacteroidales bacterium]|nr:polysaccharide deacetylase family protein [Candidatus Sodaliphilus aphodohippi]